ncbi:MAG: ABC transporter substrate-binding protein [Spirochaetota bacterium]|nr:ABC transporter substrate-binding protein [Spirochaetota bacterium]
MEKKIYNIYFQIIVLVFIIIFLFIIDKAVSYAEEVRGVTTDTIKIAAIGDQTGPVASIGIPIVEATRIFFRNINDQGGINGRKVKYLVEDDHYTIPGAISAFKKLIFKDKVLSILYCGGTGQVLALMRQIEKHKVPIIPVSLAEIMTTPLRPYIFTPSSSYDDGLKVLVDYIMKDLKAKSPKIAVVYPDNEFGKVGYRATEKYLKNYNLKVSSSAILAFGAIDASSQVLSLKRTKPNYILVHNGSGAIVAFLKSAKRFGFKSQFFGTFYVSCEDTMQIAGSASEGLIAVTPYGFWSDDLPGIIQMRKITKKYQPNTKPKLRNYVQGWVTSMICAEGLRRAGKNLTPDTLVKAYESFRNFKTGEISGPISYSIKNHKGGRTNKLVKTDVKNQRFISITGFREPVYK